MAARRRLPRESERAPLGIPTDRPALPRVHNVPAKLNNTLESRGHVRHPKVGQREPIARPAPALV